MHTCAQMYAIGINRQNDQKNKTEKDKNFHKDAQGLNSSYVIRTIRAII